jgi:excisionase family DNA binding protein
MKVLRPKEVAERWKCSRRHVYTLIANGSLDAFRIGGRLWRVLEDAVEEFEKCHPNSGPFSSEAGTTPPGVSAVQSAELPFAPKVVRLPNPRCGALPHDTKSPTGRKP